jgi:hypothetical protein
MGISQEISQESGIGEIRKLVVVARTAATFDGPAEPTREKQRSPLNLDHARKQIAEKLEETTERTRKVMLRKFCAVARG